MLAKALNASGSARRREGVARCTIALVRVIWKHAVAQSRQHKGVSGGTADESLSIAAHSYWYRGHHSVVPVETGGSSPQVAEYFLSLSFGERVSFSEVRLRSSGCEESKWGPL